MKVKPKSKEEVLKFVETIKHCWNDWRESLTASGVIEVEGKICHSYKGRNKDSELRMYVKASFEYYKEKDNGIAELNFNVWGGADNHFTDDKFFAIEALSNYRFINTIHDWMQKFSEIGEVVIDDI